MSNQTEQCSSLNSAKDKMRTQKTSNNLPNQAQSKSVQDLTPFELAEIDAYQNQNRGFNDEDEEQLENFNEGEEWN